MAVKAPVKLGLKARKLWDGITGTYQLRPDELRVLEDACRTLDLIERLETELASSELMLEGSMRQPIVNPLVAEIRQHRAVLQRLLVGLKLPDEPGGTVNPRSVSARTAAMARWGHGSKAQ